MNDARAIFGRHDPGRRSVLSGAIASLPFRYAESASLTQKFRIRDCQSKTYSDFYLLNMGRALVLAVACVTPSSA